ncbi:unnamed protein product, partial [Mesorhabditis belari]|uniref:Uncharacterized protein n=1 Tax=Mesorhabditis belari TaxID=2138241 RepID=A0AAF3F7G3_9BILA
MPVKSEFSDVSISTSPYYAKVLAKILEHHLETPGRAAFISAENPNESVTWLELFDYSHSLANFFKEHRFERGEVCCLVLPNCWQYAVGFLGVTLAGGAASGASAMFTDYELERQFIDSQATAILTDETHLERVRTAVTRASLVKTILCIRHSSNPLPQGVYDFAQAVSSSARFEPDNKNFSPDDLLLLPYSSGTTGSPKGVMLTHKNFGTMTDVVLNHFHKVMYPEVMPGYEPLKESVLLLLPFYHIYGFGLLMKNIFEGTTGVIFSKFDPVLLCQKIQDYKVQQLFVVPPIVIFLAKHPAVSKFNLSSVKMMFSGAAPCGKDIIDELLNKHKTIRFFGQGYGMTECGMVSHLPAPKAKSTISAGRLTSNFVQKIVDLKTGKECKTGDRGEVWVAGPTIMKGYLNRPEATAETIDKDGWLHTGDIGYLDKDGNLFVVDRLKELIKVKGLQVPPAELEDLLLSHPKIRDAAVIGIPDSRSGEAPKAFVVRADDHLSADDVINFVKSKVSSYKQLTGGVEFLSEIPKAPSGKILRRLLRDQENAKKSKI